MIPPTLTRWPILKSGLPRLTNRMGIGETFHSLGELLQDFWAYDSDDKAEAITISNEFLSVREQELADREKK